MKTSFSPSEKKLQIRQGDENEPSSMENTRTRVFQQMERQK